MVLAIDPGGLKGVHVRARAGPARDRWLAFATSLFPEGAPRRRLPAGCDSARLAGGIDVAATLSSGRPILDTGLLAAAHGGLLVAAMAERLERAQTAVICSAIEAGAVRIERDGFSTSLPARFVFFALDEGADPGETISPALADRLGLVVDLSFLSRLPAPPDETCIESVNLARERLHAVEVGDDMFEAFAQLTSRVSPRRTLFLFYAARACAALRGSSLIEPEDAARALPLVLGVDEIADALQHQPQPEPPPPPPEPEPEPGNEQKPEEETASDGALADVVLEAAIALLPPGLLEAATGTRGAQRGRSSGAGAAANAGRRGPVVGNTPRAPFPGARPNVLATLRAAVPWQAIRRKTALDARAATGEGAPAEHGVIRVLASDFRYLRRREPQGTTVLFVVDASGSAAAARLAEAKGAVELLLAESYRRRDEVALIAFRGSGAEIILRPTRSLVRAKRALAGLPGGGGTPLADAILAAATVAEGVGRAGRQALTVFLTDGRPNIGFGGVPGRAGALEDAERAALRFRSRNLRSLVIDTAARPQPALAALAGRLGAEYQPLPRGDGRGISRTLAGRLAG
ncbi:VWA domain-containing protein [Aquibium carbonis]|nr:VWA domain-containing protein [Aquibium carbonis]